MPPILGNLIVIAVVALIVFLAVRSIWRAHKAGKCVGCGESCSSCGGNCAGCHLNCPGKKDNEPSHI